MTGELLADRARNHGDFSDNAVICQALKKNVFRSHYAHTGMTRVFQILPQNF
jgi:hypothetical protein